MTTHQIIWSTHQIIWTILSKHLPNELIFKIIYDFEGIQHPLVSILRKATQNKTWDRLTNLPFSKKIQKYYYKYGLDDNLQIIINNKQKYYYMHNCSSYISYNNPGYFIPRQKGRLYYSVLDDNTPIENIRFTEFKLERSKNIIKNILCVGCNKLYIRENPAVFNNYIEKYGSYTKLLDNFNDYCCKNLKINKWLCNYCYNVGFNQSKPTNI